MREETGGDGGVGGWVGGYGWRAEGGASEKIDGVNKSLSVLRQVLRFIVTRTRLEGEGKRATGKSGIRTIYYVNRRQHHTDY